MLGRRGQSQRAIFATWDRLRPRGSRFEAAIPSETPHPCSAPVPNFKLQASDLKPGSHPPNGLGMGPSTSLPPMAEPIERNLGLDLVRVTETAAMAAARWMGRGDKEAADQAAVDGMRAHLATLDIDGVVIIGEGEKDSAPMLYNGERVGTGRGVKVEVAVDPVDGTTLTSKGEPGALSVIAVTEGTGLMYSPGPLVYMDKIAVGPEAAGLIDLDAPVEHNLRQVAKAKGKDVNDLTVVLLDRPRNESYIQAVRVAGARIQLIRDGDVAASIATARSDTSIDLLLGIGGSPEAVLSAAALKCMGGEIQCRLWPRDDARGRPGPGSRPRPPKGDRHR